MPREARITVPGAVHHIMSRGIEGCPIFRHEDNRWFFKALLEKNIIKSGFLLYAWCLMDNHYHLLIRMNEYPLWRFMGLLNGPYAQYFRKNMRMRGYLFQDRYKSIVTQDQHYIEELVRYVHLNPVRAGICSNLDSLKKYPWCGHSVVMGAEQWEAQNVNDVLLRFDKNPVFARKKYLQFLQEGISTEPDIYTTIRAANDTVENIHNTGSWVIGNKDFITKAIENDKMNRQIASTYAFNGKGIEKITEDICRLLGVEIKEIKRKGRNSSPSKARRIIAFIANRKYRIPTGSIARYFEVTSSAVSNMVGDGEVLTQIMKIDY
jgi:putative transposase